MSDNAEVRVARADLGKRLMRLVRDGMSIAVINEADPDDPESDYIVHVVRRTEIRDGI